MKSRRKLLIIIVLGIALVIACMAFLLGDKKNSSDEPGDDTQAVEDFFEEPDMSEDPEIVEDSNVNENRDKSDAADSSKSDNSSSTKKTTDSKENDSAEDPAEVSSENEGVETPIIPID